MVKMFEERREQSKVFVIIFAFFGRWHEGAWESKRKAPEGFWSEIKGEHIFKKIVIITQTIKNRNKRVETEDGRFRGRILRVFNYNW